MGSYNLSHLKQLEAESIHIIREVAAEFDNPVMLYSIGKDSSVMLHLAHKAFALGKIPFPLMHVDTQWKFQEMYKFRTLMGEHYNVDIKVWTNPEGRDVVNPFSHGSEKHTQIMKTDALAGGSIIIVLMLLSVAREEMKRRVGQKNGCIASGMSSISGTQRISVRSCGMSIMLKSIKANLFASFLVELDRIDIWLYLLREEIPIVPLYYAAERPVVERDGVLIMVDDDDRMPLKEGEVPMQKKVRFRTLGCYPLTGAVESNAETVIEEIVQENAITITSERQGRVIDGDNSSMEDKKKDGYF